MTILPCGALRVSSLTLISNSSSNDDGIRSAVITCTAWFTGFGEFIGVLSVQVEKDFPHYLT